VVVTAALSTEQFDDLHDFVRTQVAAGYTPVAEIAGEAVEAFADGTVDPERLRAAALAVVDQVSAAHRAEQRTWPATTDCDRLDAAFAALETSGIVARQHFSCCGTCGAHEIMDEMNQAGKAGRQVRGYTFFHLQDTEHAVAGEGLYLSYGSLDSDQAASVAVGHEVMAALHREGLQPAWNGKIAHRILLPLRWQRRRG
jgi:hypothetical protein